MYDFGKMLKWAQGRLAAEKGSWLDIDDRDDSLRAQGRTEALTLVERYVYSEDARVYTALTSPQESYKRLSDKLYQLLNSTDDGLDDDQKTAMIGVREVVQETIQYLEDEVLK